MSFVKKLQMVTFMAVMLIVSSAFAQPDARLQVIHNSADPAAEIVDIYVNGALFEDDFEFRTATPFLDVPANVTLNIGVAPGNSTGPADIIATIPVTLDPNRTYVAIANGVLDPNAFAANPDNKPIGFDLYPRKNVREEARWGHLVDFIVFHGSTDAPTVDVRVRGGYFNPLVNNLSYGEFSWYKRVWPREYVLDITPGNDPNTVVASFVADLSGLGGGAAVVFASGFLNPSANQNGAAFGIFAALPDGTVVEFPAEQKLAKVQVIHNSADPAASMVDIYLGNDLIIPDFEFRTATPFVELPAEVELAIGVAPGNSSGPGDIIATIPITLENNKKYIAVANGVLDPGSFAANPDGVPIGFNLFATDGAREEGKYWNKVDLLVFHGSTDAPTVDVLVRDAHVNPLIDDLTYTDFQGYASVPENDYILDITPGSDNSTIVASFGADLSGLGGGAAVVFASGFFNPADNQSGAAFGLFAALPDGTVIQLPAVDPPMNTAKLQVIHNAADPAAEVVDIYVNGGLFQDDFMFRTATPFVDVPAGVTLDIGVAPGTSTGPGDIIATIPVMLETGKTYVAIANGVLDPSNFAANPNGESIGFDLYATDGVRTEARWGHLVDLLIFHGSTDAPRVDVRIRGWWFWPLVNNIGYGDFASYRTLWPKDYILDITPGNDPFSTVASFQADLSGLGGGAAVVFASGFLNPDDNQFGPAFGLYAALPDGTVIELPAAGGSGFYLLKEEPQKKAGVPDQYSLGQNYPNPFNPTTTIQYALPKAGFVNIRIYNVLGQEVRSLVDDYRDAGVHTVTFDADNLSSGMYFYRINSDDFTESKKMLLLK